MTLDDYQITIRPLPEDESGGFFAEVPDLPGCHTDGKTPQEALANLYDAFAEWTESMTRMGAAIPQPRRLAA